MERTSDEKPSGACPRAGSVRSRLAAVGAAVVVGTVGASVVLAATGDPVAGKTVFKSAGCTGCHTLAAVGATGTVGPNLDQRMPTYDMVVTRVTAGKGVMPSFSGSLSAQQIADVAAFVSQSTGGSPVSPPQPATSPAPGAPTPATPATPATPGASTPGAKQPGGSPAPGPAGRTPSRGALAPAAGSHSFVRVTFTGGRLAATAAKIPAGTVTIVVRNAGRAPLRVVVGRGRNPAPLAMMARGTARKVWALPRGSARRVTLRLAGGERGYVCRVVRRRRANCLDFRVLASTKPAANTAPETGSPRETPVQETSPAPQPWPTPAAESPAPAAPPPAPASPAAPPAQTPPPAPANGKVFFTATCGGCHTLADAGTTGKVGPNLDKESPNASKVRDQVLSGGGGMPSFRNVFTPVEIDLIARYVDSVT